MRVLVTRPESQAGAWLEALRAAGHEALALPLIEIGPPRKQDALRSAWQRLPAFDALMVVSANAVEHFFGARPEAPLQTQAETRWWATGPGTVAALVAQGVPLAHIDAPDPAAGQFDSEALWAVVQPRLRRGGRVLVVRGNTAMAGPADGEQGVGRDWLAQRLAGAGVQVEFVVAYERHPPALADSARDLIRLAAEDGSVWLFSSSEAVTNLRELASSVHWAKARAIVTHARIGEAAREAGFGVVLQSRPELSAIVASIESLA